MEFPWQGSSRYPPPRHLLARDRSLERHLRVIRIHLDRQGGMATFVTFRRSGRRRAYEIRDALDGECDVMIFRADPDSNTPNHRHRFERYRIEILIRELGHPSLSYRREVEDPAIIQLRTLSQIPSPENRRSP